MIVLSPKSKLQTTQDGQWWKVCCIIIWDTIYILILPVSYSIIYTVYLLFMFIVHSIIIITILLLLHIYNYYYCYYYHRQSNTYIYAIMLTRKALYMVILIVKCDEIKTNKLIDWLIDWLIEKNGDWVWYTSIQKSSFCKWPWILNWRKWIPLVDSPTQILLTIIGSIDHSSRCKLNDYVKLTPKRSPAQHIDTFRKICKAMEVKRVSKIMIENKSITIIHLLQF